MFLTDFLCHGNLYWAHIKVFWVVMPHSIAVGYQRFGGQCCLHCTLKMETARSFETPVSNYITAWHHNTKDLD